MHVFLSFQTGELGEHVAFKLNSRETNFCIKKIYIYIYIITGVKKIEFRRGRQVDVL